jgi:hypothetical protein
VLNSAFGDTPYHYVKTWLHNQNTKCCIESEALLEKDPKVKPHAFYGERKKLEGQITKLIQAPHGWESFISWISCCVIVSMSYLRTISSFFLHEDK